MKQMTCDINICINKTASAFNKCLYGLFVVPMSPLYCCLNDFKVFSYNRACSVCFLFWLPFACNVVSNCSGKGKYCTLVQIAH